MSRIPGLVALPLGIVAALLALPSAAVADTSVVVPADVTSVTVRGSGFGHGHGMSQYGAKVAAERGLDHRRILAFYYPGTSVGQASGKIRVLLSHSKKLVVKARPGLTVRVVGGKRWKVSKAKPKAARTAKKWRAVPVSASHTRISYRTAKKWRTFKKVRGEVQFSASGPMKLKAGADSGTFRGVLRSARPAPGSRDRDIVNVVPLEAYLRGVVPAEMPALWAPQAVNAQAVAARSYAVYERTSTNRGYFDVYDTTMSQVYAGTAVEHPASDRAIKATRGEIRTYQGRPAITQFSSSNGGWMLANSSVPYLVSKKDPYDPATPWQVSIPAETWAARFGSTWPLASITVRTYPAAGSWVDTVTLTGTDGRTNTISGTAFRSWAGLRSSAFTFAPFTNSREASDPR